MFLKINHINIGAPIKEVTIPTGISDGEMMVLAITSDNNRNMPPIIILPGIVYLWSDPSKSLDTLGTISPAKEIIPAIDTAEADNKEAIIIEKYCNLLVFNPNDVDSSLPNERTLYSLENRTVKTMPVIMIGIVDTNSIHPLPDKPPLSQYIICVNDFPE